MTEVKLNSEAVAALLKSEEVQADLQRRGEAIASAAGAGFVATTEVHANRARCGVYATTADAMLAEQTSRALTSAIDAGRT